MYSSRSIAGFLLLLPCIVVCWFLEPGAGSSVLWCMAAVYAARVWFVTRPRPVYLIDFACFDPPPTCRIPFAAMVEHVKLMYKQDAETAEFMIRVQQLSGLGEETALPPVTHYIEPDPTIKAAREEADLVLTEVVERLLRKTGVGAGEIGALVVNCSVFSPSPSLSCMVANRFGLREDVKTFNISGMGCSAELVAMDAARAYLRANGDSYAVVVSTEIITPVCYTGNDRSMLVTNCLFRMGGSAVLLSNRAADRSRAKYVMTHLVRSHIGSDDGAFGCVGLDEDSRGVLGMRLTKALPSVASRALEANVTALAPAVLPASEKLRYLLSLLCRLWGGGGERETFVPNFKTVFQHFCIHAGGVPLIDHIRERLRLSAEDVEASRMTLHRVGNTSSSSVWYELGYLEAKRLVKPGHNVWQIALGGGFKCISAVWKCNRPAPPPTDGPWSRCIHKYPALVKQAIRL